MDSNEDYDAEIDGTDETPVEPLSELPTGVINEQAWREYEKLQAHPLLSTNARIIDTSDESLTVDLLQAHGHLKKKIAHLPAEEQERIQASWKVVASLKGKLSSLKKKCYGIATNGLYSFSESILEPKKAELLELFGRYYSSSEVHRIVTKSWGYNLSHMTVERFRVRWLDEINKAQYEYSQNFSNVRLYHRRSRMDELSWLYDQNKGKYIDTGSLERSKELRAILKQIKDEADASIKLRLEAGGEGVDVHALIDLQRQKDLMQRASLTDIIIGRIAARTDTNPAYLVARLNSSFYKDFNGVSFDETTDLTAKPMWPSQLVYDMDAIKARQADRIREEQELKQLPVITDTAKAEITDLRQRLRDSLRNRQTSVNQSVDKIDKSAEGNE